MELMAVSFFLFFGSTYCCSTLFLRHESHLHEEKLVKRHYHI